MIIDMKSDVDNFAISSSEIDAGISFGSSEAERDKVLMKLLIPVPVGLLETIEGLVKLNSRTIWVGAALRRTAVDCFFERTIEKSCLDVDRVELEVLSSGDG